MQQDLVDKRGGIAQGRLCGGLARSTLAPGPLAAQLAIYLGTFGLAAGCYGGGCGFRVAIVPDGAALSRLRFALAGCPGCGHGSTELVRR